MPQYRIEISPNNRAGCKDTVCKENQTKILKGEIRFGSWVEIHDHGSWSWKHWGCISGAQVMHLQEACDQGDGTLNFDAIDGFDELNDHADIQEKIRRCVRQGHIDPEDFMGDPEKNVPGEKGIRMTAKQRAAKEKAAAAEDVPEEEEAPKKKATKRGLKKGDIDDDEDGQPAVKKAKPSKAAKPTKAATPAAGRGKSTAKKPVAKDESDAAATEEEEAPAKKARKPSAKATGASKGKESAKARGKADDAANDTPKKTRRSSRVVAKSSTEEDESVDSEEEPAPAAKGKRGARSKEPAAEQPKPRRGRPRNT
ncbi:poly(ADP-ribose) polymerase and DNA-Ligase zn-finger domain-containing protein [Hirsutella rhossiliensis]|uniref:Poly(ADP-ribose) polymerase and DNA-Ligase zn-finger domain-containing protein n=1 Tax=Hirsutella rhossiliensis TaxID=111463 RepID=A0A9P8SI97_9HYPO|nr:poly(ADP-ribose) polymerase and DNA-Ligase zn-finger domain-containing protein [Hirsutella rhossiliensis]KAH0963963.1 poly(ADP-ribose) polymerase and DNA-Ligase zn-finger domain-containing protein [Hirsutella rhossiliensis]